MEWQTQQTQSQPSSRRGRQAVVKQLSSSDLQELQENRPSVASVASQMSSVDFDSSTGYTATESALLDSPSPPTPLTESTSIDPSINITQTSFSSLLSPMMERTPSSELRARRYSEILSDLDRIQQRKVSGSLESGLMKDGRTRHPSKIPDPRIRRWSRGMLSPIIDSKELESDASNADNRRRHSEGVNGDNRSFLEEDELGELRKNLLEEKKELEIKEFRRRISKAQAPARPSFSKLQLSPPTSNRSEVRGENTDVESISKVQISIGVSQGKPAAAKTSQGLGLSGVPTSVLFTPNSSTPAATSTPTSSSTSIQEIISREAFQNAQTDAGKSIQLKDPPSKSRAVA